MNRQLLEWININKDKFNETELKNKMIKMDWGFNDINDALDIAYGRKEIPQKVYQETKTYLSPHAFQKDLPNWKEKGWVVASQTSHKEPYHASKGCCLLMIFAPLALFGRGKSKLIVTYEHRGQ